MGFFHTSSVNNTYYCEKTKSFYFVAMFTECFAVEIQWYVTEYLLFIFNR